MEADTGKLWRVRQNNGGILSSTACGEYPLEDFGAETGGGNQRRETYRVSFPQNLTLLACPVEGCPARDHKPGRLWEKIMYQHWKAQVLILQEGVAPFPQCPSCGMHMHTAKILCYQQANRCNQAKQMRLQSRNAEIAQRPGDTKFRLYHRKDDTLVEGAMQFQYLGRTLEETESNLVEVHQNISKVRAVWQRLEKLLRQEGENIRISDLFYREVMQTLLMFVSDP